jgi:hypothetical protein
METNLVRTSPTKAAAVGPLSETIKWLHALQGMPYMHGSNSCGYPTICTRRGAFVSSTKHSTTSIQEALMQKRRAATFIDRIHQHCQSDLSYLRASFNQAANLLVRSLSFPCFKKKLRSRMQFLA